MHDSAAVARAFDESEASFRLEGLDPSKDSFYQNMKARRIAGTITADEAHDRILDHYRHRNVAGVVEPTATAHAI